jgi:hypothetical protein
VEDGGGGHEKRMGGGSPDNEVKMERAWRKFKEGWNATEEKLKDSMRRGRREDEKRQRDDLGKIERDWSKYRSRVEGVKVEDWWGESAESCENRENMSKYISNKEKRRSLQGNREYGRWRK